MQEIKASQVPQDAVSACVMDVQSTETTSTYAIKLRTVDSIIIYMEGLSAHMIPRVGQLLKLWRNDDDVIVYYPTDIYDPAAPLWPAKHKIDHYFIVIPQGVS